MNAGNKGSGEGDASKAGQPRPVTRETLDPRVLEMLVCPMTKTQLILSPDRSELISLAARLAYPVNKGVPLMCLDESRPLSDDEIDRFRRHGTGPDLSG